eukprot:maker-scaffold_1-snap-gene-23.23-mRNA-1 protein AED:0.03 eAED:0.03 QI:0/0/0/1/1/1/2/0/235
MKNNEIIKKKFSELEKNPWKLSSVGDTPALRKFANEAKEFDVEALDELECTCIVYACRNGHLETAKYLIEELKANIEAAGYGGLRALHHAVNNIHQDMVKYLLDKGADPNAADDFGNTALHYACERGVLGQIDMLLAHDGKLDVLNNKGISLLHKAANEGHSTVINKLLQKVDVNLADKQGNTVLHYAVANNFPIMVELLLDKKNEINLTVDTKNCQGCLPIDLALSQEVKSLLS